MRISSEPQGTPIPAADPPRGVRGRHRKRRRAAPPYPASSRQGRLRTWLSWTGTVCGVLAGLGLIASAVLLGVPADAGEGGPTRPTTPVYGYRWPLDGTPQVTRRFEPPPEPWLAGHRGVDLAALPETLVRAAGPGVVAFAGPVAGRGVVSIQHPNGLRTTYEPLQPSVVEGQRVRAGDVIGRVATGHRCRPDSASCLHWGLRHGDIYLDPLSLLGVGRVRLLPLRKPDHSPTG